MFTPDDELPMKTIEGLLPADFLKRHRIKIYTQFHLEEIFWILEASGINQMNVFVSLTVKATLPPERKKLKDLP